MINNSIIISGIVGFFLIEKIVHNFVGGDNHNHSHSHDTTEHNHNHGKDKHKKGQEN